MHACKQTDRQTYIHTDRQTDIQICLLTKRNKIHMYVHALTGVGNLFSTVLFIMRAGQHAMNFVHCGEWTCFLSSESANQYCVHCVGII